MGSWLDFLRHQSSDESEYALGMLALGLDYYRMFQAHFNIFERLTSFRLKWCLFGSGTTAIR